MQNVSQLQVQSNSCMGNVHAKILEIILITALDILVVLTNGLFSKVEASNLKFALTLLDKAVNFILTFSFEVNSLIKIDLISLRLYNDISY